MILLFCVLMPSIKHEICSLGCWPKNVLERMSVHVQSFYFLFPSTFWLCTVSSLILLDINLSQKITDVLIPLVCDK